MFTLHVLKCLLFSLHKIFKLKEIFYFQFAKNNHKYITEKNRNLLCYLEYYLGVLTINFHFRLIENS